MPGKSDEYVINPIFIGLNNITKSCIHELETELNKNPFKNIQSVLGELKRNLNMNNEDYKNILLYNNAINKYKTAIKNLIQSSRY